MKIKSYSFGRIEINDKVYRNDVIVYPDRVKSNWWRIEGHKLHIEDLKEILEFKPEIIVVGTGAYGFMKVLDETKRELESRGIKLIIEKTSDACISFNKLLSQGKRVVAALHLTC